MDKWKRSAGFAKTLAVLAAFLAGSGVASAQHPLPGPWQHADVGDVGLAGNATIGSDGDLFINGAGSDIWGTADSFHFAYRPIEDGQINSEPPRQDATNPFAKVGLMIRMSLDPGSPHVVLDVRPNGEIEFMTRQTQGGQTTYIGGSTARGYLELTRSNGTVTGAVCPFNTNSCQTIGSVPFPSGLALAGAIITSHDPSVLNHGYFAANVPTVITVPSPWREGDVGNVGTPGWAVYQNGTFTIAGAGADIWGTTDAYHAVESFIGADGVIVARVTAENAADTFAKAGVIANSNYQSGPSVILDVRPNGLVEFMARPSQGGQMAFIAGSTATFPVWLKLQRTGGTFTGYILSDGNTWQNVGSTDVSMPTNINVGIVVTSHDTSALNTSTFDHLSASSATPIDSDIGDVGAAGSVAVSETDTRVSGAGADIWGTADAFNYYYSGLSNDGGMFARVVSLDNTSPFAKAGIMIRASTDPSAAQVILDVKPDGGIEFMTRSANGASTTFLAGSTRSFPVDFWLVRVGATVNAWIIDGTQETLLGSTTTDLPSDALIGLAVTSHQRGTLASAHFAFVSR
jgi:hypothetical protein